MNSIKSESKLPYNLFEKTIQSQTVILSSLGIDPRFKVNSVGTIPAALTAYDLLDKNEFDLVINPGTAGGFKRRGEKLAIFTFLQKSFFIIEKFQWGLMSHMELGELYSI